MNIFPAVNAYRRNALVTTRATLIYCTTHMHRTHTVMQKLMFCTVLTVCEVATEPLSSTPTHSEHYALFQPDKGS